MSRSEQLLLPRHCYEAMLQHAQKELPNECCGLLAGERAGDVLQVVTWHPLVNAAPNPTTQYLSDDKSLLAVHTAMRRAEHDIMAVYHSHPTSEPVPSRTDLAWEYYFDVVHIIIGLDRPTPLVRGWWLSATKFEEAAWSIVEV